jgi:hypothetical protein
MNSTATLSGPDGHCLGLFFLYSHFFFRIKKNTLSNGWTTKENGGGMAVVRAMQDNFEVILKI